MKKVIKAIIIVKYVHSGLVPLIEDNIYVYIHMYKYRWTYTCIYTCRK